MSGSSKPRRRVVRPQANTHQDTRKEQLHLTPGTPEYEEYIRDRQGIDEKDFVADDRKVQEGDDRRPDKFQKPITEPEHVKKLAGDLRKANDKSQTTVRKVGYRKFRSKLLKEGENGELVGEAVRLAALTEDKEDDYKARKLDKHPGVRELVYDDGCMQDEYVPRGLRFMED